MIVKDLICRLKQFPENSRVCVGKNEFHDIDYVNDLSLIWIGGSIKDGKKRLSKNVVLIEKKFNICDTDGADEFNLPGWLYKRNE